MINLNLVIADYDELYVESLSKFITLNYGYKINIFMFTDAVQLKQFLKSGANRVDILLVSPDVIFEDIQKYTTGMVIYLIDGSRTTPDKVPTIMKYQSAEKLFNEIMELYAQENSNTRKIVKGNKNTSIIAVFSPCGGSGKTVVSINIAYYYARKGLKVLYLNLETISSASMYINRIHNDLGLSNVFLGVKQGLENLAIRIESAKSHDSSLNFDYFREMDCALEYDEITDRDMERLINELAGMGKYDVIVVDMDSTLNKKNLAVLDNSDLILMLLTPEAITKHRLDVFNMDLKKVGSTYEKNFYSKVIPVMNCPKSEPSYEEIYVNGAVVEFTIPYIHDLITVEGGVTTCNYHSAIRHHIEAVGDYLLETVNLIKTGEKYADG